MTLTDVALTLDARMVVNTGMPSLIHPTSLCSDICHHLFIAQNTDTVCPTVAHSDLSFRCWITAHITQAFHFIHA